LRKPQSGHWDGIRRFSNEVNEEISRGENVEKTWTERGENVKKREEKAKKSLRQE
jgi:hypothetical protein